MFFSCGTTRHEEFEPGGVRPQPFFFPEVEKISP